MSLFFYESQILGPVGHRSSVLPPAKAVWRQSYLCFCLPWTWCRRCERHQLLLHNPPGSSRLQNLSGQSRSVPRSDWPPSQERVTEDRRHGPAHRALRAQPRFSYWQPKCPLGRDNLSGPQLPPLPKRDPPSIPRVHWAQQMCVTI